MVAGSIDIAEKAQRTQFALIGGFCGVVLLGSIFSQTQRALLDAGLAPPAAFVAVPERPSTLLPSDQTGVFPRPAGFAGTSRPRPGRAIAAPGTPIRAGVPGIAAPADGFVPGGPAATPQDLGVVPSGTALASNGGIPGFPAPSSFLTPPIGGSGGTPSVDPGTGTGPGVVTPPDTATPPGTGTNPGTDPGTGTNPGTDPGTGTNPDPGTNPGAPPPETDPGPGTTPTDPTAPETGTNPPGTNPDDGTTPTDPVVVVPPGPGDVSPVPEPSTWAMLLSGFFLVGWGMRRQRRRAPMAATLN